MGNSFIAFDRDGNRITNKEQFLELYRKEYANRNCMDQENRICAILHSEKRLSRNELDEVLCWKTSKRFFNRINRSDRYYQICDIDRVKPVNPEEEEIVLTELLKVLYGIAEDVKGIGTVYTLNFLFFLSGGYFPIYDQFAMKGLTAIEKGMDPSIQDIPYIQLPDLKSISCKRWMELLLSDKENSGSYRQYMRLLNRYFPEYKEQRQVDQALWVYGHKR